MVSNPSYPITIILSAPPFGWFGLHHLYVGNTKRAILYTIFSWTLIPVGISTIESLFLIKRGREDFLQKHGSEEELEKYYVEQLKEKNPGLLNPEVAQHKARRQNNYQEGQFEQEQQNVEDDEANEEEQNKKVYEEPDYSDYYGNW